MSAIPTYSIRIADKPINLQGRLINISVIDKRGIEADELSIEIDDTDGQVALPPKQAIIDISFGYQGGEQFVGKFTVDTIEFSGPPDKITIRAKGAALSDGLTSQKYKSWHDVTLGDIIQTIASNNDLEAIITPKYQNKKIEHIDQTNESDAHFLTRLAKLNNAISSVKSGKLIFVEQADGKSASGQELEPVIILKSNTKTYTYSQVDRQKRITGVKAFYTDKKAAKKEEISVGTAGYMRNLKQTYPNKEEAYSAAKSEFKNLKNQAGRLNLNLAYANVLLAPETPVKAQGFKTDIDNASWLVDEVNHNINDNGFISNVKLFEVE